jgi:hypothetical protein
MHPGNSETQPIRVPAKSTVLLIFMPPDRTDWQRSHLTDWAEAIKQRSAGGLRVLKVEQASHPEVVQSFDIRQFPTLVLVQQGTERWRQEGPPNELTMALLDGQLTQLG